jgi:predicted Zn-dependent peptidase
VTGAGAVRAAGLSVLIALSVLATGDAANAPSVSRQVLPNGMTILVRESRAARVVAVSLQVAGGAAFEAPAAAGITNLVHRMMVRGTTRLNAIQLAEAAESLGGGIDGSGDVDHAEIRAHGLASRWQTLIDLVAEVVLTPAFSADELERTRRVVLGQIRARADTPRDLAMELMTQSLYGAHPYALPAMGTRETITSIGRDALVDHYRRLYRPDHMVLAVSGDVPAARVARHAERLFAKVPRQPRAPETALPEPSPEGGRRVVVRPAQQAQVLIGFLGPRLLDSDYAATKLLVAIIGGGTAGRLFQEIRERQGLAYSVGVLNASRVGRSAIVSSLGTEGGNIDAAESSVKRELARIRSEAPSEDELTRAKAYVLGMMAMDRRTNAREAWYLAFFELVGARWDFPARYAQAIESVTAADVVRAAERHLEHPTIVIVEPAK